MKKRYTSGITLTRRELLQIRDGLAPDDVRAKIDKVVVALDLFNGVTEIVYIDVMKEQPQTKTADPR